MSNSNSPAFLRQSQQIQEHGRPADTRHVATGINDPSRSHGRTEAVVSDNRSRRKHQSAKPYPDYPLTAHPSGRWCKKVKGKILFFGPIGDGSDAYWRPALDKWLREKDDLLAGRTPRPATTQRGGLTLLALVSYFMRAKEARVRSGELTSRMLGNYHRTCRGLVDHFGRDRLIEDIRPTDFSDYRATLARRLGPVALGNAVNMVRIVFRFAWEERLGITEPVFFGSEFKRPSRKTLRIERARRGKRYFTAEQLRTLLEQAEQPLKAMMLLALNAGLGNSDLARLPQAIVNFKTGWVDYARGKTGIARRFCLWPETLNAIREAIDQRPKAKSAADRDLVFLTRCGVPWVRDTFEEVTGADGKKQCRTLNVNAITGEFSKLCDRAGIQRVKGCSFYALRHTFRTEGANATRDEVAVNWIMGHAEEADDMSAVYTEGITDERLQAVSEGVYLWLFKTNSATQALRLHHPAAAPGDSASRATEQSA